MYICAHNKAMRSACFVYWEITGRKKKKKEKEKPVTTQDHYCKATMRKLR